MFRSKEYCIKTLHQLYRKDKWINELFKSAGLNLDNLSAAVDEIYNNIFLTQLQKELSSIMSVSLALLLQQDRVLMIAGLLSVLDGLAPVKLIYCSCKKSPTVGNMVQRRWSLSEVVYTLNLYLPLVFLLT